MKLSDNKHLLLIPGVRIQGYDRPKELNTPSPKVVAPLSFTVPYPPSVNSMYEQIGRHRKLSEKGKAFKTVVGLLLAGCQKFDGDVCVSVWIYRPRLIGDLDNRLKALLDSMTGIVYDDDQQVQQIHAVRYDDKDNPRAEVTVSKTLQAVERIGAE